MLSRISQEKEKSLYSIGPLPFLFYVCLLMFIYTIRGLEHDNVGLRRVVVLRGKQQNRCLVEPVKEYGFGVATQLKRGTTYEANCALSANA